VKEGGGRALTKTPFVGRVLIFSGTTCPI